MDRCDRGFGSRSRLCTLPLWNRGTGRPDRSRVVKIAGRRRLMKQRFAPIALFLTWVGILVAYWPSGCAQQMRAAHPENAQPVSPAVVQMPATTPGVPRPLLPHPAFAFAQEMSDKNVAIADIAERSTPSVVNVASRRMVKPEQQQQQ